MKQLFHTIFLILLALLTACQSGTKDSPPHIILFLADDLGYNDLSCYREHNEQVADRPPTARTPHIDRLAREGMRFTNFYAGAAVCSPSRSALLTGRNCTRLGIYNWIPPRQPMHLRDSEITLAEMLKPAAYQTAHFGKWHLTSEHMGQPLPTDQGYDYAYYSYNNAHPSHRNPENYFRNGEAVGAQTGYACQLVVDEALQWLKGREGAEEPFYINIWFNEPHEKVAAPEDLAARHAYRQEYYGCIENMDLAVGRVLDYLDSTGLAENTLVIFTSDNGSQVPGSNDPLRGEKAFNLEGGIREPFLIRWKGRVPEGRVSDVSGSFTDMLPSLASLTGVEPPADRVLDGMDLSGAFLGDSGMKRTKPIFFFRYFHDPVCMLREGDYVLLGYVGDPLPDQSDYDQKKEANLQPDPDRQPYSMWNFQPIHMEYLKGCIPENFELYHIGRDIRQVQDISVLEGERSARMKERMLELREEMIAEGGDWYK